MPKQLFALQFRPDFFFVSFVPFVVKGFCLWLRLCCSVLSVVKVFRTSQ